MKPRYITPIIRGTFSERVKRLDLQTRRLCWCVFAFWPILILLGIWAIWQIAKAL